MGTVFPAHLPLRLTQCKDQLKSGIHVASNVKLLSLAQNQTNLLLHPTFDCMQCPCLDGSTSILLDMHMDLLPWQHAHQCDLRCACFVLSSGDSVCDMTLARNQDQQPALQSASEVGHQ